MCVETLFLSIDGVLEIVTIWRARCFDENVAVMKIIC